MQSLLLLAASTGALAMGIVPRDTACTIGSGENGVCLLTSTCSSSGGTHTANYCPGPADIQCCTYGSCKVGSTSGVCELTSTCSSKGGKSTPGYCPGAADIQCCTSSGGGGGSSSSCPPAVNTATLNLVESFEGWDANIYLDPDGNPTIGYGHLCSDRSCSGLGYPIPLSKADGDKLLQSDLRVAEVCVRDHLSSSVKLNANQYGALVSFTFNVGCGNFESSTLLRELNAGDNPDNVAAAQLPDWVYGSNDDKLPGLVRRRAAEVALFKTADSTGALPC